MRGNFNELRSGEAYEYLLDLRYRREFHLSARAYAEEPYEEILKCRLAWELEAERDKLEKERQAFRNAK